jgi:hypothetical protein
MVHSSQAEVGHSWRAPKPTTAELNRRYGAWGSRIAYQPSLSARFLGKIGYCAAVANVGIDALDDAYVLPIVMGRDDMTGHWVGNLESPRFARSGGLHALETEARGRDLLVYVTLFEPFQTPKYVVVVGRLK